MLFANEPLNRLPQPLTDSNPARKILAQKAGFELFLSK